MSIEEAVVEKLRVLPLDKQQEVLDFVEFLENKIKQLAPNPYPLRGSVLRYEDPFEPAVPIDDWEVLR